MCRFLTIVAIATSCVVGRALPALAQRGQPRLCGDPVGWQVHLDRRGFSSGEIDGRIGANTRRALRGFQEAASLSSGAFDCESWHALTTDAGEPIAAYTVTEADVAGPFADHIPADLVEQARLPSLGYRTVIERLAERFHASPVLLQTLNGESTFRVGETIKVPHVTPFDLDAKIARDPSARDIRVVVTRENTLTVRRADGSTVFFAPVSSGSVHDPLPLGQWKVTTVNWMPAFYYNPDLFWDAKSSDTKAAIRPGPNNPVGVVWIDISVEHYGLHGTPEPSRIGRAQSHGCVRLTNWDAARVAAFVGPDTPVEFK